MIESLLASVILALGVFVLVALAVYFILKDGKW